MTLFWILAATLLLAVLLALLLPLLSQRIAASSAAQVVSNVQILRDQRAELSAELAAGTLTQELHDVALAELERRVLDESASAEPELAAPTRSRTSAVALALGVPALAVGLYALVGNPLGLDPLQTQAPPQGHADASDVEAMIGRLAQRLREQPDNVEGWALLGRTYASMQRYEPARDAYARAVALRADDAQLLADYADTMAMTQGQTLAGEPERLIMRALQADPNHVKSLALAGSVAMERKDYAGAVRHWTKARAGVPAGDGFAAGLDSALSEARAAAGLPPAAAPAAAEVAGVRIDGEVRLAPALLAKVQPGDTLFVFARAAEGPRIPLAIQRGSVGQWPVAFTLDDSMAMSPELKLSGFDRVVIGARISRSGNATPQPGDLEGQSQALKPSSAPVVVTIDSVRP